MCGSIMLMHVCVSCTHLLVSGWWLALFSWGDTAVLAWPVAMVNLGNGLQLIEPKPLHGRWCYIPIIDLSNIAVAPMAWKSWAWQLRNVQQSSKWKPHVRMFKEAHESCTQLFLLSLFYIHIYIYIHVCTYVCLSVCVCIHFLEQCLHMGFFFCGDMFGLMVSTIAV